MRQFGHNKKQNKGIIQQRTNDVGSERQETTLKIPNPKD
jgi:hypothetical protein